LSWLRFSEQPRVELLPVGLSRSIQSLQKCRRLRLASSSYPTVDDEFYDVAAANDDDEATYSLYINSPQLLFAMNSCSINRPLIYVDVYVPANKRITCQQRHVSVLSDLSFVHRLAALNQHTDLVTSNNLPKLVRAQHSLFVLTEKSKDELLQRCNPFLPRDAILARHLP